jgi:hypothetical protein
MWQDLAPEGNHITGARRDARKVVTMSDTSAANLELAIVLPLGAIANQLTRVEADLRFLHMKVVAKDRGEGVALDGRIVAGLDKINEVLDSIRGLMADLQADLQPAAVPRSRCEGAGGGSRKAQPERDD